MHRTPMCALPVKNAPPTLYHLALLPVLDLHRKELANAMPATMATALSAPLATNAPTRMQYWPTHAPAAGLQIQQRVAHATQATMLKAVDLMFNAPSASRAALPPPPLPRARALAHLTPQAAHATQATTAAATRARHARHAEPMRRQAGPVHPRPTL
jgi:hypothetical protein